MTRPLRRAADPGWAFFLDLDGTLVPLTSSPRRTRGDAALRRIVGDLHARTGGAVAIITGRPIETVDRFFPGLQLAIAGLHGLECRNGDGRITRHARPSARLDRIRAELERKATPYRGLDVEDKSLAVALHYRRAPGLAAYTHRLAREAAARLGAAYTLRAGKRVIEITPAGRDKGKAITALLRERPFRGRLPVFLGDDVTDELGFGAVNRLGGLSVKVGPGRTEAEWRLPDVAAARRWLRAAVPAREARA